MYLFLIYVHNIVQALYTIKKVIGLKEMMCAGFIKLPMTCNTGVKRFDSNQTGQSQP